MKIKTTDIIGGGGGGGGDYVLLDTIACPSGAREVSFTDIDQGYHDLIFVIEGNTTATNDNILMVFNGSNGRYDSNICSRFEYDTYLNANSLTVGRWSGNGNVSGIDYAEVTIFGYSATDRQQKLEGRCTGFGGGNYFPRTSDGWWSPDANQAITQVDIYTSGGNYTGEGEIRMYGRGKV